MLISRIRELVSYCPETGVFTNLVGRGTTAAGITAGSVRPDGYVKLGLDGKKLYAHRVAWMLSHGEIPGGMMIDHIDGDRSNNRLSNLRLADKIGNARNCALKPGRAPKTSSFRGVKRAGSRWEARIRDGRRQIYLRCFKAEMDAALAYDAACRKLHGEFGRLNFPDV